MSKSAYIKLVPASKQQSITLEELKELFFYYKELTAKTGEQLNWQYSHAAFPYELEQKKEKEQWFYLKGQNESYRYIIAGISSRKLKTEEEEEQFEQYIQIVLPEGSTHGDKGKANEFCKFLAKQLQGELQLFNGRTMYYYKRK
ncbi:DUF1885 family protein [Bacillus taeanensis]|uniref:DUF1885 domain-containing protein n=1 Tax=Bacillus taeanensis TaxID=273032 RepID=A0A366XWK8_9BACI|nr:DUF1885 family protein [Bacillus taeanensis]RBW70016.1 hypothetical protein DS031_09200 [Bacillus taeanensis]